MTSRLRLSLVRKGDNRDRLRAVCPACETMFDSSGPAVSSHPQPDNPADDLLAALSDTLAAYGAPPESCAIRRIRT
jgi:hypothetical protein